ncbi:hypothetical protein WDU94_005531 [Cyamophila willieti]
MNSMFSIYTSVNLYTSISTLSIISPDSPVVTCVISMQNIPGSNHAGPYFFFFFFFTSESHFISTLRLSNMVFFLINLYDIFRFV